MWLIVPNSDGICMARVWLGTIAIAILLGTSIARASQIRQFASIVCFYSIFGNPNVLSDAIQKISGSSKRHGTKPQNLAKPYRRIHHPCCPTCMKNLEIV